MNRFEPDAARAPLGSSDLRVFRLFQHLGDAQLARLAAHGREHGVAPGQVVYDEGGTGDDFFVVLAGSVEGRRSAPGGRRTVTHARVGQLFGEVSFLDGQPRDLTAVATGPGAVVAFSSARVRRAMAIDPELGTGLARTFWLSLAAKIREANQLMGELLPAASPAEPRAPGEPGEAVELGPSAKLDLFAETGLSAAELRLLATTLRAESFPPGATIFLEGQRGDSLYIVARGQAIISRAVPGRGESRLATLGRGEVFGEMALVDDQLRSADARSGPEGCTTLLLSHHDLDEVLQRPSDAAVQFLGLVCRILCRRFRAMVRTITDR